MSRLLVICGPTATGKTNLGVRLAKKFNGEIVSADSRQVYKGMDITTGKDLPVSSKLKDQSAKLQVKNEKFSVGYRLKDRVPVWLVDIVEPDYRFNVGEYKILAEKVINDIRFRGLLPIIVGGTGLYIRALTTQLDLVIIPPDKFLRRQLGRLNRDQLAARLFKKNPEKWDSMNESDRQNPRRLIRAIEISHALKKKGLDNSAYANHSRDDVLLVGLTASSRQELNKLIDRRIEERAKAGAIEEARNLLEKGYSPDFPAFTACGYRPLLHFVERIISLEEAIKEWKGIEHGYAGRQLTWFKKDKRVRWFDIAEKDYLFKIEEMVEKWYTVNKF